MKSFTSFPSRPNDAILMVQSYREGELQGFLAHSRLSAPKPVKSMAHFLLLLDDILLREEEKISYHSFEAEQYGSITRIATIRIQILFREHHTWQGFLQWEEEKKEASFRSALELIELLDEILAD